jgi:hypothetical protein
MLQARIEGVVAVPENPPAAPAIPSIMSGLVKRFGVKQVSQNIFEINSILVPKIATGLTVNSEILEGEGSPTKISVGKLLLGLVEGSPEIYRKQGPSKRQRKLHLKSQLFDNMHRTDKDSEPPINSRGQSPETPNVPGE